MLLVRFHPNQRSIRQMETHASPHFTDSLPMTNPDTKPTLYDELVPKVGHDNFKRALNHVAMLIDELIQLVRDADAWGSNNGFPEVEQYPQYKRVRQLGEEFNKLAGIGGMQKALSSTQRRLVDFPPEKYSYAIIVHGWAGIGGWSS